MIVPGINRWIAHRAWPARNPQDLSTQLLSRIPQYLIYPDGALPAFHEDGFPFSRGDAIAELPESGVRDQDLATCGAAAEPHRQVHGITNCGIVHPLGAPDIPGCDLPGIDADPDPKLTSFQRVPIIFVSREAALDFNRGLHSPHGIVRMRNGGPKESHQTIAQILVQCAPMI